MTAWVQHQRHHPLRQAAAAWLRAALLVVIAAGPALPAAAGAATPGLLVAVVEFYAASPMPVPTVLPEQYAADDLSAMLARTGAGRITVIPRADVQLAERALAWQNADALRFARLGALAGRLGATRLVVGWIENLSVGKETETNGGGVVASAVVQVRVFDASQGRITWQMQSERGAMGIVMYVVAQDVLHQALAPTVVPTIAALTAGTP